MKDVLAHWVIDGRGYCLTHDTGEPGCYRVHVSVADSVGAPCWRQVFCTYPQNRATLVYDRQKQALHDTLTQLHQLCRASSLCTDEDLTTKAKPRKAELEAELAIERRRAVRRGDMLLEFVMEHNADWPEPSGCRCPLCQDARGALEYDGREE